MVKKLTEGVSELQFEEVFDDLPAVRVLVVKELRVKLDAEERAAFVLHRLDRASLIRRGSPESRW